MLNDEDFIKAVKVDLERVSNDKKLSKLERPKEITFTLEPFTPEKDLVTPTFKLKRRIAKVYFDKEIQEMYGKVAKATAAQQK